MKLSSKPDFRFDPVGYGTFTRLGLTSIFQNNEYAEEREKIRRRFRNLSFIDYPNIKVEKGLVRAYYSGKSSFEPYVPYSFQTKNWTDSADINDHVDFLQDDYHSGYYSSYIWWGYKVTLPIRETVINVPILITTKEYVEEFLMLHPKLQNKDKGLKLLEQSNLDAFYIVGPACERVAGTQGQGQVTLWNQPIAPEMWAATRMLSAISNGYIASISKIEIPGVFIAAGDTSGKVNKLIASIQRGSIPMGTLTKDRIA
jgi:hypothetical protein